MKPTTYTDSKGKETPIVDMNPMKLINALEKMKREGWDLERYATQEEHDEMLAALEEQAAVNRTAYIAELTAERPGADSDRQAKIDEILAGLAEKG